MESNLLATKVRIPPQPHHAVQRPRLIETLEHGIPQYKLVLLSAPAGYGKTTLLAQWSHASRFPVAWLSLSEDDNDWERFFRYILAAWEEIDPSVKESTLGLLLSAMSPENDAVLSAFVNVAGEVPDHLAFVLNDYHLIEDPAIHQALTFLLDHLPPTVHFVLAGRAEPPLPLARYRARGELLELRAEDLQFRPEETEDFLNGLVGLRLTPDEIAPLHTQLEGWAAGLQLASLALRRHPEAAVKLAVSGKHRFIADYLSQDVLAHLPEDVQRFMLQTSVLDRLSGSLCDAVTEGQGSQQMLELLERENLFLMPLDDSREWFRYHRLFADFLQEELNRRYPGEATNLHRPAARWHYAHDLPDQTLRHAVAAEDAELALQVFDTYFNVKLNSGELTTIRRWLELVPEEWHSAYPLLGLARAGLFAFTGALDDCVRCIDDVEQRLLSLKTEQARRQLAKASAVRCAIACIQNDLAQAETYAGQVLEVISIEDDPYLHLVYGALGDSYRHHGRWEEAREYYTRVLSLPHGPAYSIHSVHVLGALADLELRQGHLRKAAAYWREALAGIDDRVTWGTLPLPLIGWVYIRMGEVLYEWDELADARDHLSRGLERAELGGDVRALIAGYLLAGRLKLTEGDIPAAAEYLEQARPLVENAQFSDWTSRFERFQLEIWLAQGALRSAVNWANEILHDGTLSKRPESEESQVAAARVLIVKGVFTFRPSPPRFVGCTPTRAAARGAG
jgi:LuxR family maltose regulon positive regulatory protein